MHLVAAFLKVGLEFGKRDDQFKNSIRTTPKKRNGKERYD
jgi:hypothetical protein